VLKEINTSADQDKGLLVGPTKTHASRSMKLPAILRAMLAEHLPSRAPQARTAWP
jgi:hypothetical protein